MNYSKKWGKWFGEIVYKQADRKKLGRKDFERKIEESHNAGMVKALEIVLEKIEDPEERGTVHLLMVEAKKEFDKWHPGKAPLATIQRTVRLYES